MTVVRFGCLYPPHPQPSKQLKVKDMKDLMIPRYEIIADWPNRPLTMPIGHILYLNKFGASKYWHEYTDEEPLHLDEGSTRYPAVLRKLEWWEKRTAEEMPEYVKHGENGKPRKVKRIFRESMIEFEGGRIRNLNAKYLPATATEYNDYIKTNQP